MAFISFSGDFLFEIWLDSQSSNSLNFLVESCNLLCSFIVFEWSSNIDSDFLRSFEAVSLDVFQFQNHLESFSDSCFNAFDISLWWRQLSQHIGGEWLREDSDNIVLSLSEIQVVSHVLGWVEWDDISGVDSSVELGLFEVQVSGDVIGSQFGLVFSSGELIHVSVEQFVRELLLHIGHHCLLESLHHFGLGEIWNIWLHIHNHVFVDGDTIDNDFHLLGLSFWKSLVAEESDFVFAVKVTKSNSDLQFLISGRVFGFFDFDQFLVANSVESLLVLLLKSNRELSVLSGSQNQFFRSQNCVGQNHWTISGSTVFSVDIHLQGFLGHFLLSIELDESDVVVFGWNKSGESEFLFLWN